MSDKLYDDLTSLFNPKLFRLLCCGGIIPIKEKNVNATVKKAEMDYHGKLLIIDGNFLSKSHEVYEENELRKPELRHDCDGIFFLTQGNQKYFILIELKSKYSKENIEKAEKQLAASYIRVYSYLSCLSDFNARDYKACGIIVSHAPDIDEILNVNRKKKVKQHLNRYEKQMDVFRKKMEPFDLNDWFVHIKKIPIHQSLLFDTLPVFHVNVASEGSSVRFKLDSILKRL